MVIARLGSKPDSFQLQGQTWVCTTGLPSDIIVEIEDFTFHLHKFPLLSRSGLLEKMIAECHARDEPTCRLRLQDIPGGAAAFELIAKFCYGVRIELNAFNAVSLRCAAQQLVMTEDYGESNLIRQTDFFLDQVFASWKDSILALEACEDVLLCAEELGIVDRCIDSLAIKACTDLATKKIPSEGGRTALWNGIEVETPKIYYFLNEGWWHEDVSFLNLLFFKRLLLALESKGMKPEGLAGAIIFYAKRYLPGLSRHVTKPSSLSELDQRHFLEEIVSLLPSKKGVAPAKFLLSLLRSSMILQTSAPCKETLEKRAGAQLDEAGLEDILIPCMGSSSETLYDVDCVQRMLDHFMQEEASLPPFDDDGQLISPGPSLTSVASVAKLTDAYLGEVASDPNLKPSKFQSLAAAVPDYARALDDGLYRAIDIYLKGHCWMTDSEREQLCRLMNCQKLSVEACAHAAQNERLPLRVIVQVLFFEQLRLRTSIAGWFFVSDGLEHSQAAERGRLPAAGGKNEERASQTDASEEEGDDGSDMRQRLSELEKECTSIKKEIDKMGKPKTSAWSRFPKSFGF